MTSVYDSERLAAGYAFDRPPVHEQILRSARLDRQARRALDVGYGAGLSTAALAPLARQVTGLEPVPALPAHRRAVAPHARFVIGQVADAAVKVFTDKGFRSAGISDVAAALGLSHGALYTYVDSKQALLYLALLRTIRPDAVATLTLPVAAPPTEEIVTLLESWMVTQTSPHATGASGVLGTQPADQELGAIIDALYGFIERNRRALQLINRCAADLPELANWFFVQRRRTMLEQLGVYLEKRIQAGELRPVPDVPAAARFINETIAWFAMHRHGDADSAMLDDDACRRTVRHLLLAAFLPEASETA